MELQGKSMLEDLLKLKVPPFSYCVVCEEPFPVNLTGEIRYCSSTCMGMHHEFTGGTLQPDYYDTIKDKDILSKTRQWQWIFNYFVETCKNFQLPLEAYTPKTNQNLIIKLAEFKENFNEIKNKVNPPLNEVEQDMLIRFVDYLITTKYWYDAI